MAHISYVDPATVTDPELAAIMKRARLFGTPRPESQAIRLHNPPVMKAFNNAWEAFFRQGVTDHAIKELCRLYIAKSVECEYCGGQRSVLARPLSAAISSRAASTSARARRARRRNISPASVRRTPLRERSNSSTPSSCSRSRIWCESAGWATGTAAAALVKCR